MEAKQVAYLVVAVVLGAVVVFVVGFQAGAYLDGERGLELPVTAATAQAGAPVTGAAKRSEGHFSFFEELRAPATVGKLRKLDSPQGNANNTPELEKQAQRRRDREARRKAWAEGRDKAEESAPARRPVAARTLKREATEGVAQVAVEGEAGMPPLKLRAVERDPAAEAPAVRRVEREGEAPLQVGAVRSQERRIERM